MIDFRKQNMSSKYSEKNWIIKLDVRPNEMLPINSPLNNYNNNDDNDSGIFSSIYSITL
jgi:hypothetical protein